MDKSLRVICGFNPASSGNKNKTFKKILRNVWWVSTIIIPSDLETKQNGKRLKMLTE